MIYCFFSYAFQAVYLVVAYYSNAGRVLPNNGMALLYCFSVSECEYGAIEATDPTVASRAPQALTSGRVYDLQDDANLPRPRRAFLD